MDYTKESCELIRNVALGIGWYAMGSPPMVWPAPEETKHRYIPVDDDDDLLAFTAYAKAEMAKRGYAFHVGSESVGIYWPKTSRADQRDFVAASQLDDTDPISEAEAALRCIADALRSNAEAERPPSGGPI